MSFEKNVFINCPFDNEYRPLLRALIFTILYLELEPQIAVTVSSGNIRIQEIMELIRTSKYSIHDISRCEPLNAGELPRFNMPYEMGLDIGCCIYGNKLLRNKKCLILEKEKNRYDTVISDISGQDIKEHGNAPEQLIARVREWLFAILDTPIPPASKIWAMYSDYLGKINTTLLTNEYTQIEIDNLPTDEFIKTVKSALRTPAIGPVTFTIL
jgi:hypothetical protein